MMFVITSTDAQSE